VDFFYQFIYVPMAVMQYWTFSNDLLFIPTISFTKPIPDKSHSIKTILLKGFWFLFFGLALTILTFLAVASMASSCNTAKVDKYVFDALKLVSVIETFRMFT